jgi:tyrosyl-tRNA synthetase
MIGDPTDKTATRKKLTREEVLENCKLYKQQASFLLDFDGPNAAEFRFNSEWLAKMSFVDVVELASHFTVQQMMERDMFEKRMEEGKPIHLHEFLYPLMQGYDSVALDVDIEIGGNDQTFNMLAGRTLFKAMKQREKFVLANRLLSDPTGKKMGKSEGNMLALTDDPKDAYGKVMSWTDEMIVPGFEICTQKTVNEVTDVKVALKNGENPIQWKKLLASQIVEGIWGEESAKEAADVFVKVHSQGEKPEEIAELLVDGPKQLIEVLVEAGFVTSKADARRQIEQGGVKINDEVVTDIQARIEPTLEGIVVQKGKRHFVKVIKQ